MRINVLLLLPAVLYVTLAFYWQSHHIYLITGDEPHYLLIADSIVRDGDLRAYDHLPKTTTGRSEAIDPHVAREGDDYSIHGVGFPVLLALPYLLGGVTGAKVFAAMLAGLLPLLFFRVIRRITGSKLLAMLLALALACGLPYLAASNQIFPDLLGGLIILYAAEKTGAAPRQGENTELREALLIGALIALLPWLHLRLGAPALVLLGGYVYALLRVNCRHPFLPAIPVGVSLALLGFYNELAFGSPLGPYAEGALSHEAGKIGMVFLGLHLDGMHGAFAQQPLLLLGLIGIVPLVRMNPRFAVLLGILYLSIIVPNAAHPNWYGGWSFAGRFGWASVSLWVFPLSYALKWLWDRTRAAVHALIAFALGLQAWFATKWLTHDSFLYNRYHDTYPGPNGTWPVGGLYAGAPGKKFVSSRVPFFGDFDHYLHYTFNYAFVLLCVLLVLTGLLIRRSSA